MPSTYWRTARRTSRGDQDVSVTANAKMLEQFLDALNVEQADLVGNDSGGGITQIFSALYGRTRARKTLLLRKSEILIVRTTVAGVIATAEHTIRPVLDCSAT